MYLSPKAICRFNAIPIKIQMDYFTKLRTNNPIIHVETHTHTLTNPKSDRNLQNVRGSFLNRLDCDYSIEIPRLLQVQWAAKVDTH